MSCKKLDYADQLVNFELFFRDALNRDIWSNEDLEFVKAKTAKAALSSYITYIIIMSQNLSKYHFSALKIKT